MGNNVSDNLNNQGVGVGKLAAFSIGSTLASGVFYVSGSLAVGAYGLATMLGWLVCGFGTFAFVMAYYALSVSKPEMKSGLYAYAKSGFGDYMGFNIAWGYWASAMLAQVSFCIALFTGLGEFFKPFGSGNTLPAVIGASIILWLIVILISKGIKEAMGINLVVVIAKVIPICVLIIAIIFSQHFKFSLFMENFYGDGALGSVLDQVKSTMFFTVWIFIGFEASIVASGRGKDTKTAGKATLISFICLLAIYMMLSILSLGVLPHAELAAMGEADTLSMGGVLASVVGPWGMTFVAVAVIISVGGALYTYTLLCSECMYMPAKDGTFPKFLAKENKHNAPITSLIFTIGAVQLFLILVLINESSYTLMLSISTCMIMFPYLFSALYFIKVQAKNENQLAQTGGKKFMYWIFAAIATLYGIWMLFSSGWQYILITSLLYAPGVLFYFVARREQGKKLFSNPIEMLICGVLVVAMVASIVLIANKTIEVF